MKTILLFLIGFLFSYNIIAQNLGINNLDPQAALDLKGDLRLRTTTLNLPQGISHNVDLTTNKAVNYNFEGGSLNGAIISGFTGGVDGRLVTIFNNSTSAIQLFNEAAGSLAQNRLITGSGNAAIIYQNGSITMRYDGQKARWTIVASNYTDGLSATSVPSGNIGNYGTVINPITGKVWLDRNLGASQVATSSTDVNSFGDLYQWGRNADGHQLRTSATSPNQVFHFYTNNGMFIINNLSWLSTNEPFLWAGIGAQNNPCPSGFRIPTAAEWGQEKLTWSSKDPIGAFTSILKLPLAGYRNLTGLILGNGTSGHYWSNTNLNPEYALGIKFYNIYVEDDTSYKINGQSLRCIKD